MADDPTRSAAQGRHATALSLARELDEAMKREQGEFFDYPWEHLGDAEKDVRVLVDGLLALDALLAERQQDKERIERLERAAKPIIAQARFEKPEDFDGGWFIDGESLVALAAAAFAVEEDTDA